MSKKLIPPDKNQCQAMKPEGCHPNAKQFMILGPGRMVRCSNKPEVIITERKPNAKDGMRGSMSLCPDCLVKARSSFPKGYFTEAKI